MRRLALLLALLALLAAGCSFRVRDDDWEIEIDERPAPGAPPGTPAASLPPAYGSRTGG